MPRTVCSACLATLILILLYPAGCGAYQGVASGRVALIDTPARVYGFSPGTGYWTGRTLDSPLDSKLVGAYIGYARSWARLYAYNSNNGQWYVTPFQGAIVGEDVENTTAIAWTASTCYGIATPWNSWASCSLDGRLPVGGGSAGTFGLVWTKANGYAYNASTGQWTVQAFTGDALGGIVTQGMGLVWTHQAAHVFNSQGAGSWSITPIEDPVGMSVAGMGRVGVVWGKYNAYAYSGTLSQWSAVEVSEPLQGGSAGSEVALLWTSRVAYGFDAATGSWSSVTLQSAGDGKRSDPDFGSGAFLISPNPASGLVTIDLPASGDGWKVAIYDLGGTLIRGLEGGSSNAAQRLQWDRRNDRGEEVAAGTYWIQAESSERAEARRVVLLK